ncbi:MAG: hypothetical protein LBV19_02420 [Streptococcaceae bacterium]|nr:hypothetical protein [Streptococcaceae bacterium]
MTELKEELRARLSEMSYGEIQVIPMIDRGPYYRETEAGENGLFSEIVPELISSAEDVISVQRNEIDTALNLKDIENYLKKMTAAHHLIFVDCLELGTSEIRAFLSGLKDRALLKSSKVFLLDLPQLEYLMLRDSLAGEIEM